MKHVFFNLIHVKMIHRLMQGVLTTVAFLSLVMFCHWQDTGEETSVVDLANSAVDVIKHKCFDFSETCDDDGTEDKKLRKKAEVFVNISVTDTENKLSVSETIPGRRQNEVRDLAKGHTTASQMANTLDMKALNKSFNTSTSLEGLRYTTKKGFQAYNQTPVAFVQNKAVYITNLVSKKMWYVPKHLKNTLNTFSWEKYLETNLKAGELRQQNISDIWSVKVPEFLDTYKNPCWLDPKIHANISNASNVSCLPYFFLAGFPKCATTDLFQKLSIHPQIASSAKEPHWWTRGRLNKMPFDWYIKFFNHATSRINNCRVATNRSAIPCITVDASASTVWDNYQWNIDPNNGGLTEPRILTLHYIKTILPQAKFIVIMRDPIDRLYSDYLYFDSEGTRTPQSFHVDVIEALQQYFACLKTHTVRTCTYSQKTLLNTEVRFFICLYYVFLKDLFEIFPRDQVLTLSFSQYSKDPHTVLTAVSRFLGIGEFSPATLAHIGSTPKANTRSAAKHSVGGMANYTRHLLTKFFAPFNKKLHELLNDDRFIFS